VSEKAWKKRALECLRNHPKVCRIWQNDTRRTRHLKYGAVGKDRPKGLPDTTGWAKGPIPIYIELKDANNTASDEQLAFLSEALSDGCYAGLAYDEDDLNKIMAGNGQETLPK